MQLLQSQGVHPHVVRLRAWSHVPATQDICLLYDRADLGDLFRLCGEGQLGFDQVIEVFIGAVGGLQFVHEHNVVHGDVKAANILVRTDAAASAGVAGVLADFGLCCNLGLKDCRASRGGTPYYMAPEVEAEVSLVYLYSDVHSLGVTLGTAFAGMQADAFQGTPRKYLLKPCPRVLHHLVQAVMHTYSDASVYQARVICHCMLGSMHRAGSKHSSLSHVIDALHEAKNKE